MKIKQRYKRLSIWNKLGVWGSIASIFGILLAAAAIFLGLWFWLNPRPVKNEKWSSAFDELQNKRISNENVIVSRNFKLLKEKGSSLTIGPCPAPNCFIFKLGDMYEEKGIMIQKLYLEGGGFGYNFGGKHRFESTNLTRFRGTQVVIDIVDKVVWANIPLNKKAELDMWTKFADIKFRVIDTDINSLSINVTLSESTKPPIPPPPSMHNKTINPTGR